jgi:glutathione S-transferase
MTMKLHVFPLSPRAFKVLWCANHLEIPYQTVFVDLTKGAQRTPEFTALNPNARMPVLEEDGFVLWESNAILQYLASKKPEAGLFHENARVRAAIAKWQFWDSAHWDPTIAVFVFENYVKKLFGRGEPDPAELARGRDLLARNAPALEAALQRHRYVAGDRLTLADFSLGAAFTVAEAGGIPLEEYRGIQRWGTELRALPSWHQTTLMQTH